MRMAWATNVGAIAHVQATRAQRLPPVPPTPYPRAQPFAVPRGPGGAQATSPAATSKHSIAVCAAHTLPWPPLHVSTLLRPLTTVCDLLSLRNRSWGFVAFDNKRFAVKALESIHERPFLVGVGHRPVIAEWARNEELTEGFSEEVRAGAKAGSAPPQPPPENAGRIPPPSSKDGLQASRLMALRREYDEIRAALKARMVDAEQQILVTGNAPPLRQMMFGGPPPPMGPPPPHGPMGGPGIRPPQPPPPMGPPPQYGPPPPMGGPPPMGPPPSMGPMSGVKRDMESFHSVPPPSKRAMHGNLERFNPNPNQQHPQQQQHQYQPPAAPEPVRPPAFVRGGELTVKAEPGTGGSAGATGPSAGHKEGGTAPPAAGAKPPGSHDHGGIGFSGPPPSAADGAKALQAAASAYGAPTSDGGGHGRAPYTAYQYSYGAQGQQQQPPPPMHQQQQAPQGPPAPTQYGVMPPANTGVPYGAPPPAQPQQPPQQQYGMYGAAPTAPPPASAPDAVQQPYGAQPPAGQYGVAPPDQQQQYQQYYQQYYGQQGAPAQQAPPLPQQQPQMGSYPPPAAPAGGAGGPMGQQQQPVYGMQQQPGMPMYGSMPAGGPPQQPGQMYYS